ncbi:hypothetical protein SAMD00019534_007070 [Acytostelium subglobosum LB1]|uniref:hypothetical protein n=1 Tax=Acytostelium subglobosum LB1 TaxID=1410327 RepID=UPI000644FA10|nr:hypothetical protein SAMD00019534_007070 [Acytostelium subglobosum LB1]GAM17532.1 hypothetical protein SAMD00019534_007070 [Acytostelium subglobosum LB1]|eukprot:XP_012759594.1 hypothetical protein SAMD00019534_007070 [Acytostelium subglobosum LB1]
MLSLVNRVLYEQRNRYLRFEYFNNVTNLPFHLQSYLLLIPSSSPSNKRKKVNIYTKIKYRYQAGYDHSFHVDASVGLTSSALIEKLLNLDDISHLMFHDSEHHPFDQHFWNEISDMLVMLASRGLTDVTFKNSSTPYPLPPTLLLRNMHSHHNSRASIALASHFPASLTKLSLSGLIDNPLDFILPNGLKMLDLSFAYNWNQPLLKGGLPGGLEILNFGESFNQPIQSGVLPITLRDLRFDDDFNQPLNGNNLPPSLTKLHLKGTKHSHPLHNLPPGLTHLTLSDCYHHLIDHQPLQTLSVGLTLDLTRPLINLRHLIFSQLVHNILEQINSITFPQLTSLETDWVENINKDVLSKLPTTLKRLSITSSSISSLGILDGLEDLILSAKNITADKETPFHIPKTTKSLELSHITGDN